ncbi:cytochrome b/b6 domain-containing protein [Psychrobacter sp.]|uniref:cytochrome b n=1 Tax=Psychrobacter sp. TaxID=56811 RepID=UPI0025DB9ECA|nr:cytochrome b/b6 domain-containing protein [Psychrobacter sp.]
MNATRIGVDKWAITSRIFHWGSLIFLITTWALFVTYENSESDAYLNLHKAFGLSMLFWTSGRIINRLLTKTPPNLIMPKWQVALSHLVHAALYILLLAMPIAGLLMTVYGGHSVSFFGLFEIPVFVTPDRPTARFFNNLHTGVIWSSIIALSAFHILAALYHQFIKKDKLINRML